MPQNGLAQVLRQLEPWQHPDLLVGTNTCDDAGVFRLRPDLALVQTTDFFAPLVDDPFAFGRIAATNALSDVYAMGGRPITALNLVCFPDKVLPLDILADILRGGASAVREAGAVVVGGHSIRDNEVKFGLAVTGLVHPECVWTNAAAQPGDSLILTKPLGTGILCSAAKSNKITEDELAPAVRSMSALNLPGQTAGRQVGVRACTDVTGFGLVGHGFEMADGSNTTITLEAARVPLLPLTLDLARAGVTTRAAKTAQQYLGARLAVAPGVEPVLAEVLAGAETSGGLLLSVAPERTDALLAALQAAGAQCAALVGHVGPASDVRVHIA